MKKILQKFLLLTVMFAAGVSAWGAPTVIMSWDFDAATDAVTNQTVLPYSGTTNINNTNCDNLTGDFNGICLQQAGNWHIYHKSSKGTLAGRGLYNNNSGGRLVGVLNLKAGDIVTISANGGLPTSATNATYDSENSTAGTYGIYTVTADGNMAVSFTRYYYLHSITVTRDLADLEAPTFTITGANDIQREVTLNCLTEGAEIKYNTVDDKNADGWTNYTDPFLTSETTLYAYSEKSGTTSDVIEITTGAGTIITLNAPSVSLTSINNHDGWLSSPIFSIREPNNGSIIGTPSSTLYYTFTPDGGTESERISISNGYTYTPNSYGTLTIYATQSGYAESSYSIPVSNVYTNNHSVDYRTYIENPFGDTYQDASSVWWPGATAYRSTAGSNATLGRVRFGNNTVTDLVIGYGIGRAGNNCQLKLRNVTKGNIETLIINNTNNSGTNSGTYYNNILDLSGSGAQTDLSSDFYVASYNTLAVHNTYTPAISDAVLAAIDECEKYEISAAFASYIENLYNASSLITEADVYTAHSEWQIEQAKANGSSNYTKAIINASFELYSETGWTISGDPNTEASNDADKYGKVETDGSTWGQYYTGWNGRNVSQTIASLPEGKYRLSAKVYSWGAGAPVRLFANGALSTAENGTDHTPTLDFSVTGNESSIKIGIGGTGNNDDTDNTWGTWGYRVDDFTLTLLSVPVTTGANGYTTFASVYPLDLTDENRPDGLKAYSATRTGTTLSFTELHQTVPAGTGILLLGKAGTAYNINVAASGTDVASNDLIGVTTPTAYQSDASGNYYFAMKKASNADDPLTFLPITTEKEVTVPAGKAIVTVPATEFDSSNAAIRVTFDDGQATGINSVQTEDFVKEGIYTLSGQRVNTLSKGFYIVNGKKVLVK